MAQIEHNTLCHCSSFLGVTVLEYKLSFSAIHLVEDSVATTEVIVWRFDKILSPDYPFTSPDQGDKTRVRRKSSE